MTQSEKQPLAFAGNAAKPAAVAPDPLWYKDAIIYELHVRAFYDANGDGTGDFRGLTQKLDYLQELGVTALWLLPFYESPLRDGGYDISDYRKVHPMYGSLRDFRKFLDEAHLRGLRVITELVLNHTSDEHPWFQRARRAPKGSVYRDYYIWSDTATEYSSARIIFKDFERSNWTWDRVAKAYFWHRFYSHQPDLNFDNPRVRAEMFNVVDFWLEKGVDGFRLDAVPYLYPRDGTSCENLPETHAFLKDLRAHVDRFFPGRVLLAEANQWPEDAAEYFGDGDECHMAYHFPLMPRLFMAARMSDRFPITEILEQTPTIPDNCQWVLFLRNHDELTLEMVTDEERDYMYRSYARDEAARINLGIRHRLAPLLSHNRRLIELMNALLLSMPGTPVIYYGDELGMGDNVYLGDRDGVRTPMQWSSDRNAGFSRANPQKLFLPVIIDPEYHYEAVNVEMEQTNPALLLWWMKRLIGLRKRHPAFGRGSIRFIESENRRILAYVREYGDECILVAANLSTFAQAAQLSLAGFAGSVPVEMFGATRFPVITESPYFLSFGPYSVYWFVLERAAAQIAGSGKPAALPLLRATDRWDSLLSGRHRREVEAVLSGYLPARRWYAGKTRRIRRLSIVEAIRLSRRDASRAHLVLLQVEYADGEPELYSLVLTAVSAEHAVTIERDTPWAMMARVETATGPLALVDGAAVPEVASLLLERFRSCGTLRGENGSIRFTAYRGLVERADSEPLTPAVFKGEQSNTTVAFGQRFMLKLFRKVEQGPHPQVELERFLGNTSMANRVPDLAGVVGFFDRSGHTTTLGILEATIKHQIDGWTFALEDLKKFFEEIAARREALPDLRPGLHPFDVAPSALAAEATGPWLEFARDLGRSTGDLHRALACAADDPEFAPEGYTPFYQRSLAEGFRARARSAFRLLRLAARQNEGAAGLASTAFALEGMVVGRFKLIGARPLKGGRIRTHGDFHLGQILVSGRNLSFIDFEGEPARPISERRVKRTPWRDVAGMVRSFDYASRVALKELDEGVRSSETYPGQLASWSRAWYLSTSASFLEGYVESADQAIADLLGDAEERRLLFDTYLLDKALYEVAYELEHRPDWLDVPLQGLIAACESLTGA